MEGQRFSIHIKGLCHNSVYESRLRLFAYIFCLLVVFSTTLSADPIIVGGNNNFPPYEFINEEGEPDGFNVALTRAIAAAMGLDVEIRLAPWDQIRNEFDQGRVDVLQGMIYSQQRDQFYEFSQPHLILNQTIFVRSSNQDIRSLEDLRGKRVMVQKGGYVDEWLLQQDIDITIVPVESVAVAISKLMAGENDSLVISRLTGNYWISKFNFQDEIKAVSTPLFRTEYCYAVLEGREQLLLNFQDGLSILHQTNDYRRIYNDKLGTYQPRRISPAQLRRFAIAALLLILLFLAAIIWSVMLKNKVRERTSLLRSEIEENKKIQTSLEISELNYRSIFDNASDAIIIQDPKTGEIIDANKTAHQMFGYSEDEPFPTNVSELSLGQPPYDQQQAQQWIEKASTKPQLFEWMGKTKTGRTFWEEVNLKTIKLGGQKRLLALVRDISERKQAELAIRMSEQCFRAIADYTYYWEIWVSPTGRVLWTNPAVERITGYSINELTSMTDFPKLIVYKEDWPKIEKEYKSALRGSSGRDLEFRLVRKDEQVIWASISWQPIYDRKGVSQGHRASVRDITAQKELEKALATARDNWVNIFESITDLILIVDKNNQILDANTAVLKKIERSKEEIVGLQVSEIFDPADMASYETAMNRALEAPDHKFEMQMNAFGEVYLVTITGIDGSGHPDKVLLIGRNITELKYNQELIEQQRDRLQKYLDIAGVIMIVLDKEGIVQVINEKGCKILGYSEQEIIGKNWYENFLPENVKQQTRSAIGKSLEQKDSEITIHENPVLTRSGQQRYISWRNTILRDAQGQPIGTLSSGADITELKSTMDQLQESEERYKLAQKAAKMGSWDWDIKSGKVVWSENLHSIYGIGQFEGTPEGFLKRMHPDDVDEVKQEIQNVLKDGNILLTEHRMVRGDGTYLWMRTEGRLYRDEQGNPERMVGIAQDITERKRVEDQLKESELKFRTIFENASAAIFIADSKGIIVDCNTIAAELMNYPKEQIIGMHQSKLHPVGKSKYYREQFHKHTNDNLKDLEAEIQTSDGQVVPVWISAQSITLGGKQYTLGFFLDISERKKYEQQLKSITDKLKNAQRISRIGSYEVHIKEDRINWSENYYNLLGFKTDEFSHNMNGYLELIHPEDRYKLYQILEHPENNRTYTLEYRIHRKDGQELVFYDEGEIKFDPKTKEPLVIFGAVQDITERKRAEQALLQSERNFRELVESMTEGLAVVDNENNFFYVNSSFANMLKTEPENLQGKKVFEFLDEKNKQIYRINSDSGTNKGKLYDLEWTTENGSKVYTLASHINRFNEKGQYQGSFGVFTDISERKQIELELELRSRALASINEGIMINDNTQPDMPAIFVNSAFTKITGYEPHEILGKNPRFLHRSDNKQQGIDEIKKSFHDKKPCKVVIRNYRKDGQLFWNELRISPIFDNEGNITHYVGVLGDITSRIKAQHKLTALTNELKSKNSELESIIYVASHDLKSPLVNIQGFGFELDKYYHAVNKSLQDTGCIEKLNDPARKSLTAQIPEAVSFITQSANQIESLLNGLLRLSRIGRQTTELKQTDMNQLVADVLKALEYKIKQKNVKIELSELPDCKADPSQLTQVFTNLIDNAIKFLDDTKEPTITITGSEKDRFCIYCVEDNGMGIAPEHQKSIFEIFHRLEPHRTEGEGLGLSIVRRIIDKHNGRLWVDSELGRGSKFCFSLPKEEMS